MTAHWGGAQWVLATVLMLATLAPIAVRAAGLSRKSSREWGGWYAGQLLGRAALIAVLAWGGFWN
ncbi:hypothetical protein JOE48_001951 [Methylobacterium sp. PvR107]|nr:hypothetical protein [Methylobacterium sp. PvR107]